MLIVKTSILQEGYLPEEIVQTFLFLKYIMSNRPYVRFYYDTVPPFKRMVHFHTVVDSALIETFL